MGEYKQYDKDFKIEVIKRIESGEMVSNIAKELGISSTSIYTWMNKQKKEGYDSFVGSGNIKPQDEEYRKIQKENRDLKEENEILKKAAAYFAKNLK